MLRGVILGVLLSISLYAERVKKIIFAFLMIGSTLALSSSELKVMTENYPPYNYEVDGGLTGISVEVVKEIQKRVGSKAKIELLPWTRAYEIVQKKTNRALFSMARTDSRENLFKWVGPIAHDVVYFFKKKGSPVNINSVDDARDVRSIAVGLNSSGHLLLSALGFQNLDAVPNPLLNVRKLLAGRTDLVPSVEPVIVYRAKKDGLDPDLLENTGVSYTEQLLYIAFSKDVDDTTIEKWQDALDSMKKDGTYEKIYNKYTK